MLKERLRRRAVEQAEIIIEREGGIVVSETEYMQLRALRQFIECLPNGLIFKSNTEFELSIEPLTDKEKSYIYASLSVTKENFENVKEHGVIDEETIQENIDVLDKCLSYVSPEL